MKNCGTFLQYKTTAHGLQSHFSKHIHTKRKRLEREIFQTINSSENST